ncbi:MAG: dihydroorotate dehydrogenase electron transfer subunit [Acidobacteria bacterium]|nr:dihydroorotate dehydrogenase electron transfer subunit [Acidobacteriota bacterium]
MPADFHLRVSSNENVGASWFLITLSAGVDLPSWQPGQFVMLSLGERQDPLLRRPFSIYNLPEPRGATREVQILYKILGRGTAYLSEMRPGDRAAALLPLGLGFAPRRAPGDRLVLVAGGVGVASLHPLAAAEIRAGRRPLLLFGCRTSVEVAGAAPTRKLGVETLIATDDGSEGRKGYVSDLLDAVLSDRGVEGSILCVCGPTPMMKASAGVARRRGAVCHVSLESPMACGFGVCVGCVVGVRREGSSEILYRRTCVDGPVMDASEIVW